MSYTTDRQPQGILKDKKTFLQEGLIAEIVAIDDYSHFLNITSNRDVKEIFYHIMKEEKEHYGMFLEALRNIDDEQKELAEDAYNHVNISAKNKYKEYINAKEGKGNLLISIRQAIKGEFEAIILYENFIANLDDMKLTTMIEKIIRDEKEHAEELTRALIILDKDCYGPIG